MMKDHNFSERHRSHRQEPFQHNVSIDLTMLHQAAGAASM